MKYGSNNNNANIISNEVTEFLKRERLNERDLKQFELQLKKLPILLAVLFIEFNVFLSVFVIQLFV